MKKKSKLKVRKLTKKEVKKGKKLVKALGDSFQEQRKKNAATAKKEWQNEVPKSNLDPELLETLRKEAQIDPATHEALQQHKMHLAMHQIALEMAAKEPREVRDPDFDELDLVAEGLAPDPSRTAIKHDTGKVRMSLLSPIALFKTAKVMSDGEKEYSAHNWRDGFDWSRIADAALRHLQAWIAGMDDDPDGKGGNNLDHVACCIMMLQEFSETKPELDDRHKLPKEVLEKMYPAKSKK